VTLALTRVDDRLVHGQVVLAWGQALPAARLLVADDSVAASAWERDLLRASAGDLEVVVVTVAEVPGLLAEEEQKAGAAILLFRSLAAALAARLAGAEFAELDLGGLHYAPGKERMLDYVYLDAGDRRALAVLAASGVRVFAQDLPSARPVEAGAWLGRGAAG
jgi:mannose/fructose/N-acetylgalactosamine-specific phosphotransferase system component IIB